MKNTIIIKSIFLLFSTVMLGQGKKDNATLSKNITSEFKAKSNVVSKDKKDSFTLKGNLTGNYKGKLYLNYNGKKDSCEVINNQFYFKGKIPATTIADFTTETATGSANSFYLENEDIKVDISIEKKVFSNTEINWLTINDVFGTKSILIEKDYEDFKNKHSKDKDWQIEHYKKLDEIVSKYPKHDYSLSLLMVESRDSLVDYKKLQIMYSKLDPKSQDAGSMADLKEKIYPKAEVLAEKIEKPMLDFALPNKDGVLIDTKKYKGSVLLIDFWASWCAPCRKQIPEIAKLYERFKDKRFNVLSVSSDSSREKWLAALAKEKMQWDNVNKDKVLTGDFEKVYGTKTIPATFLINKEGMIVFFNPTFKQIETYLSENLE